eukprot:scaffold86045_cov69-Phaeocystis_antarctica.AAC.4
MPPPLMVRLHRCHLSDARSPNCSVCMFVSGSCRSLPWNRLLWMSISQLRPSGMMTTPVSHITRANAVVGAAGTAPSAIL